MKKTSFSFLGASDVTDGELLALKFAQERRPPLPSFEPEAEGEENDAQIDCDIDVTLQMVDGDVTFGNRWLFSTTFFKDRSSISAYDNVGQKKARAF